MKFSKYVRVGCYNGGMGISTFTHLLPVALRLKLGEFLVRILSNLS